MSILDFCLKLLRITGSSCLFRVRLLPQVDLGLFLFHYLYLFLPCLHVQFLEDMCTSSLDCWIHKEWWKNSLRSRCKSSASQNLHEDEKLAEKLCRYVIHQGRIFCFLHGLLRTLRKNLLLPRQGFFWCMRLTGEESFASLLEILWGRIFYFLTRDCFNVLGFIGEESFTSSMGWCLIRLNY